MRSQSGLYCFCTVSGMRVSFGDMPASRVIPPGFEDLVNDAKAVHFDYTISNVFTRAERALVMLTNEQLELREPFYVNC